MDGFTPLISISNMGQQVELNLCETCWCIVPVFVSREVKDQEAFLKAHKRYHKDGGN